MENAGLKSESYQEPILEPLLMNCGGLLGVIALVLVFHLLMRFLGLVF
jgi:hypothetical protein